MGQMLFTGIEEGEPGCLCWECNGNGNCDCYCRPVRAGYAGGGCLTMLMRIAAVLTMAVLGCVFVLAPLKNMSFAPAPLSSQPGFKRGVNDYTYVFSPQCNEMQTNATDYLARVLQPSYYTTCGCDFPGAAASSWGSSGAKDVSGLDAQVACTIFVVPAFFWLALTVFCRRCISKPVSLALSPVGMALTSLWIATFWLVVALTWISNQAPMSLCWPNDCSRNDFGDAVNIKPSRNWHLDGAYYSIGSPSELQYVQQFVTTVCSNVFLSINPPNYSLRVPMMPNPLLYQQLKELETTTFSAALWLLKLCFIPLMIISPNQIRQHATMCSFAPCEAYCKGVCGAAALCCQACCCAHQSVVIVHPTPHMQSISLQPIPPSAPPNNNQ